jgi:hypothetical protein
MDEIAKEMAYGAKIGREESNREYQDDQTNKLTIEHEKEKFVLFLCRIKFNKKNKRRGRTLSNYKKKKVNSKKRLNSENIYKKFLKTSAQRMLLKLDRCSRCTRSRTAARRTRLTRSVSVLPSKSCRAILWAIPVSATRPRLPRRGKITVCSPTRSLKTFRPVL